MISQSTQAPGELDLWSIDRPVPIAFTLKIAATRSWRNEGVKGDSADSAPNMLDM